MTCKNRKSTALTNLFQGIVWVAPSEDPPPLCPLVESTPFICGISGSMASPIPFSRLWSFLNEFYTTEDTVYLHFLRGRYSFDGESPFQWPLFRKLVITGLGIDLTYFEGCQEFMCNSQENYHEPIVVLENISILEKGFTSPFPLVRAHGISLTLSDVVVKGCNESTLIQATDLKNMKIVNTVFRQLGIGWCLKDICSKQMSPLTQRKLIFRDVDVDSLGGFLHVDQQGDSVTRYECIHLSGTATYWFAMYIDGGDFRQTLMNSEINVLTDGSFLQFKTSMTSRVFLQHQFLEVYGLFANLCDFKVTDNSRLDYTFQNAKYKTNRTFLHFVGTENGVSDRVLQNVLIEQPASNHHPLFVSLFEKHFQKFSTFINSHFVCRSSKYMFDEVFRHQATVTATENQTISENHEAGGLFFKIMEDESVFKNKNTSCRSESYDGTLQKCTLYHKSQFVLSNYSCDKITHVGTLIDIHGFDESKVVVDHTAVFWKAGSSQNSNEPRIISLCCFHDKSMLRSQCNGFTKQYDLRKGDIATKTVTMGEASVKRTILNYFVDFGEGLLYLDSGQGKSSFQNSFSNVQGKGRCFFSTEVLEEAKYQNMKANCSVYATQFFRLRHDSLEPTVIVTTVSDIQRTKNNMSLFDIQGNESGSTIVRLTNTTTHCTSPNNNGLPLIYVKGDPTTPSTQMYITSSRCSSEACLILDAFGAIVTFVTSQVVSPIAETLIRVKNCRVDNRASDFQSEKGKIYDSVNSEINFNSSSMASSTKEVISNKQGACTLITTQISRPEATSIPLIVGDGINYYSASLGIQSGTNKTEGTLIVLPSELISM